MEPTTIPHDRFVEAMRDLRQALEMAGTLYLRALGPATQSAFDEAADAFADQECISQESKARCLEDGQSHESCRAALRAEIRGGEVTTPPKSKIQEAHEAVDEAMDLAYLDGQTHGPSNERIPARKKAQAALDAAVQDAYARGCNDVNTMDVQTLTEALAEMTKERDEARRWGMQFANCINADGTVGTPTPPWVKG